MNGLSVSAPYVLLTPRICLLEGIVWLNVHNKYTSVYITVGWPRVGQVLGLVELPETEMEAPSCRFCSMVSDSPKLPIQLNKPFSSPSASWVLNPFTELPEKEVSANGCWKEKLWVSFTQEKQSISEFWLWHRKALSLSPFSWWLPAASLESILAGINCCDHISREQHFKRPRARFLEASRPSSLLLY